MPAPGSILLEALEGSGDRRTAVINPAHGGWLGEGSSLAQAEVPTIGYIPQAGDLRVLRNRTSEVGSVGAGAGNTARA